MAVHRRVVFGLQSHCQRPALAVHRHSNVRPAPSITSILQTPSRPACPPSRSFSAIHRSDLFGQVITNLRLRFSSYTSTTPVIPDVRSLLSDLWDGILNFVVPKRHKSKSKSKMRRNAGKGLKDLKNLNHCSACGRIKRQHYLCPYCVRSESHPYSLMYLLGTQC